VELAKCRHELDDSRKEAAVRKKSIISLPSQSNHEANFSAEREQWQRMSEEIIAHYTHILEAEDSNRAQLQAQLHAANDMALQLRSQLGGHTKEIAELQQDSKLVRQENERLIKTIGTLQSNYEKRMGELKDKYRNLGDEKAREVVKVQKMKVSKILGIISCFSLNVNTEGTKVISQTKEQDR
jgi:chromosome segregation ATPase